MVQEVDKTDARAGRKTGHVRWILGISLTAIVVAFFVVYLVWFA
jgi:hypothetical protein